MIGVDVRNYSEGMHLMEQAFAADLDLLAEEIGHLSVEELQEGAALSTWSCSATAASAGTASCPVGTASTASSLSCS